MIEKLEEVEELPDMESVFSIVQTTFSYTKYLEIEKEEGRL